LIVEGRIRRRPDGRSPRPPPGFTGDFMAAGPKLVSPILPDHCLILLRSHSIGERAIGIGHTALPFDASEKPT
jgi:hypothetical protein